MLDIEEFKEFGNTENARRIPPFFDSITEKDQGIKRIDKSWSRSVNTISVDMKKINSIFNKITDDNYDQLLLEIKTIDYGSPEILGVVFKKILVVHGFANICSRLCFDLPDIHGFISEECEREFGKCKSKGLIIFIANLHKYEFVDANEYIIKLYREDAEINQNLPSDINIEYMCLFISILGNKTHRLKRIYDELYSLRNKFKTRTRILIMNALEK